MALGGQFLAQNAEVVDLAVISQSDRAVFIAHRHAAARGEVEDGKPSTSEAEIGSV